MTLIIALGRVVFQGLWFVRHSYYQDALPVIIDKDHGQTAIVDKAGMVEISRLKQGWPLPWHLQMYLCRQ